MAEMQSAIASIADQLSLFGRRIDGRFAEMDERFSQVASDASGRESSDASESDSATSTDSSGSNGSDARGLEYVAVRADCGFCKAPERAADADQMPHRFSLHGYEPYDDLKSGRHGGSGTLGTIMQHLEPGVLYLKTGLDGLRTCKAAVARRDPLRADLEAVYNTLNGAFGLINTLRTIICERAKVVRPGATPGDKKRQQWVESQLNEDDYETADVAPRIRKLKALYDYEAGKADLRKLASAGGASALPGNYEANRKEREGGDRGRGGDRTTRSKSAKRRERKANHESSGGATRRDQGGDAPRHRAKPRQGSESDGDASDRAHRPRKEQPAHQERERRSAGGRGGGDQHSGATRRGGGDPKRDGKRDGGGKGSGGSASKGAGAGKTSGKVEKSGKGGRKRWGDSESGSSGEEY